MPADLQMIARSGDLKVDLVHFVEARRYRKDLERYLDVAFNGVVPDDEAETFNSIDRFILQARQRDGKTVVEHFITAHRELPPAERDLLLGWSDVVEGYFRVEQVTDDHIVVLNLLDEMAYSVYSNIGPGMFSSLTAGMFLHMRIVPVGDVWITSGTMRVFAEQDKERILAAAGTLASARPELVFRNPATLALAWDLQRKQRDAFIECFGSDTIVGTAAELTVQLDELTRIMRASMPESERSATATDNPVDNVHWENAFTGSRESDRIAVIYDELEGLNVFYEYGLVEEAFANPELAAERQHRAAIAELVKEPEVTPLVLRRLVVKYPDTADDAIRRALNLTRFAWEKDGERLIRRFKGDWSEKTHPPTPIPTRLS